MHARADSSRSPDMVGRPPFFTVFLPCEVTPKPRPMIDAGRRIGELTGEGEGSRWAARAVAHALSTRGEHDERKASALCGAAQPTLRFSSRDVPRGWRRPASSPLRRVDDLRFVEPGFDGCGMECRLDLVLTDRPGGHELSEREGREVERVVSGAGLGVPHELDLARARHSVRERSTDPGRGTSHGSGWARGCGPVVRHRAARARRRLRGEGSDLPDAVPLAQACRPCRETAGRPTPPASPTSYPEPHGRVGERDDGSGRDLAESRLPQEQPVLAACQARPRVCGMPAGKIRSSTARARSASSTSRSTTRTPGPSRRPMPAWGYQR